MGTANAGTLTVNIKQKTVNCNNEQKHQQIPAPAHG